MVGSHRHAQRSIRICYPRICFAGIIRNHQRPLQILTEDYSKIAFLTANRGIEFHTRMGKLHATRVPKAGRVLAYLPHLAQLLVGGSAPEIWRLSLYEGRFLPPLPTAIDGVNALVVCPAHGMVAAGGDGGLLECWDTRAKASLGVINAAAAMGFDGEALTALRFDASGFYLAVGTSGAHALVLACACAWLAHAPKSSSAGCSVQNSESQCELARTTRMPECSTTSFTYSGRRVNHRSANFKKVCSSNLIDVARVQAAKWGCWTCGGRHRSW